MLTIFLVGNGHVSTFDAQRWAKILTTVDVDGFRLEDIGFLYPHAPIYLLSLFQWIPGIADAKLPNFLSVLCMAGAFTLWNTHLRNKGYSRSIRIAFVILLASHPFVLWAGTTGFHNAITFMGFYLFCYGCYLVICLRDVRSLVFVAISLAVFFFTDERTLFILLALLPLIPLLAPRRMMDESMGSVYGVLAFPAVLSIFGWVFLNMIFHNDTTLFLDAPEASFRGAWNAVGDSPWLMKHGGDIVSPLVSPFIFALLAFPILPWLLWKHRRHERFLRAGTVLLVHPILALTLATTGFFLAYPIEILFLLAGVSMSLLLVAPRVERQIPGLLALLVIGNLAGWAVLATEDHVDVRTWRDSLLMRPMSREYEADRRLGEWLRHNQSQRGQTMIDDRVGFRVIVAMGDARTLVLPHQNDYKSAMRKRDWALDQVVIIRPSEPRAYLDAITQFAPTLYWSGMPGYHLVYDDDPWRVYRRNVGEREGT